MPNLNDYSVGWICTIQHEYNAAQLMLDSIHEISEETALEGTSYNTWGRIGAHNVVITMMTGDGLSSTTHAAGRLMQRCSSIRLVLLVGLGSRVTNRRHNINLGDIVVGSALVQYTSEGDLKGSKSANKPPVSHKIRTDLIGFDSRLGGECIRETIGSLRMKNSMLQSLLNRSNDSEMVCADSIQSQSNLTLSHHPKIHHGIVASGSEPVSNDQVLDDIAHKNEILCVTAQPQWVPDNVQCAVIRGINELVDSSKNKTLDQDTAIATAAYTKNLLLLQSVFYQATVSIPGPLDTVSKIHFDGILSSGHLKLDHVQKPRRFFRVGRVFAMLWTEPSLDRREHLIPSSGPIKNHIYSELRRFIVIRQSYRASICIPIHTYGGKGVQKSDIRIEDHARLYQWGYKTLPTEKNIPLRDPIGIVIEASGEMGRLHPVSLVNFGKVYTIEHGARVVNIGYVHKANSQRLDLNWKIPSPNGAGVSEMMIEEGGMSSNPVEREIKTQRECQDKAAPGQQQVENEENTMECELLEDIGDKKAGPTQQPCGQEYATLPVAERGMKRPRFEVDSKGGVHKKYLRDCPPESDMVKREESSASTHELTSLESDIPIAALANTQIRGGPKAQNHHVGLDDGDDDESVKDGEVKGVSVEKGGNRSLGWACPFFRLDTAHYFNCGLTRMKTFSHVIQHLKLSHMENKKGHQCFQCFSVFEKKTTLDGHISNCKRQLPREFFYQWEFDSLRRTLLLSRQELEANMAGTIPPDLSDSEVKWTYIWRTHFNADGPGQIFLNDIVFELAEFLRRRNQTALQKAVSAGNAEFHTISQTAYECTSLARIYWLDHPCDTRVVPGSEYNCSSADSRSRLKAFLQSRRPISIDDD